MVAGVWETPDGESGPAGGEASDEGDDGAGEDEAAGVEDADEADGDDKLGDEGVPMEGEAAVAECGSEVVADEMS